MNYDYIYILNLSIHKYHVLVQGLQTEILKPMEIFEFCLGCVCVFNLILFFVPVLFTNHSWEWGWQNSGWGFCQNKSDKNWQLISLPLPLLYLSPPSSCLIMLPCVCLSVCILCVKECVFLRSLCQCVCSSNTGFSPHYPPPPPLFLSSPLMITHSLPLNFKPNLVYLCIVFVFLHLLALHLSRS